MIRVVGPKDPKEKNAIITCSISKTWSKGLSPFVLGPVSLYNDLVAQNVENAYQYSKVYKCHTDEEGNPNEDHWDWALKGWNNPRAVRYPMGKGAKPEYSIWDGEKLGYIEARKKIYIPCYSNAVRHTDAYKRLQDEYNKNNNLALWDFDGYDYIKLGMTLEDVLENPNQNMGHAFVLAMMLEGKV